MAPHGSPWVPMGSHGSPWVPMGSHGSPWVPMGSHGSPWVPMGTHEFPWIPMGLHGSPCGFPMVPHGFPWVPMGQHGSPWVPIGPHMGSHGSCRLYAFGLTIIDMKQRVNAKSACAQEQVRWWNRRRQACLHKATRLATFVATSSAKSSCTVAAICSAAPRLPLPSTPTLPSQTQYHCFDNILKIRTR